MKSVIPFTKTLEFKTKISEITSISLEREFKIGNGEISGNLFVTGEYKSHDISANVLPFSYKIPFTIEVPDNIKEDDVYELSMNKTVKEMKNKIVTRQKEHKKNI